MKRFFDRENNRLLYVGRKSDSAMWDQWWDDEEIEKLYSFDRLCCADQMVVDATRSYLPAGSRLLEGGCGLGNNVELLARSGYEVIGVDFAEKAVERVRTFRPNLDVRRGDLCQLSFSDGYFDGYWSFGVIEHFYEGFDTIASEMLRVIRPGGYLFLTVPALSGLRKFKADIGLFPAAGSDARTAEAFFQYAYSAREIEENFEKRGFTLLRRRNWGVYKGAIDEVPGARLAMSALCRLSEPLTERLLGRLFSHMFLFIFRKDAEVRR